MSRQWKKKLRTIFIVFISLLFIACGGGVLLESSLFKISSDRIPVVATSSTTYCIAPCGVMFDASRTQSKDFANPFHELHYQWEFDDSSARFEQHPQKNANFSMGPIAGHVFKESGEYQVDLEVSDAHGEKSYYTFKIVVEDSDKHFKGETFCVSTLGQFESCPSTNSSYFLSSFEQATQILNALNKNSPPTRILLKAGEKFQLNKQVKLRDIEQPVLLGSFGNGNKPKITLPESFTEPLIFVRESKNLTITGISFEGHYDPVSGLGNHPIGIFLANGVSNATVFQNEFKGLGIPIYVNGKKAKGKFANSEYNMVVDNKITDWQDYAVFGNFGYLGAIIGNTIMQNPKAKSGSEGKCGKCQPNFPDHGPYRAEESNHILIQHNRMFNNSGWSSRGLAHQPNLRLGTSGKIKRSVVADNVFEGGNDLIGLVPANNRRSTSAVRGDLIIERNLFIATENSQSFVRTALGGIVVRNNLFVKPDNGSPKIGTKSFKRALYFVTSNTTEANLKHVNRIYGNSLISLAKSSAPNLVFMEVQDNFEKFEVFNNLVYLPFVQGGEDAGLISWNQELGLNGVSSNSNLLYAPSSSNFVWNNGQSLTLTDWQVLGQGLNSSNQDPLLDLSNPNSPKLTYESPAYNTGSTYNGLFVDFNGKERKQETSVGALD